MLQKQTHRDSPQCNTLSWQQAYRWTGGHTTRLTQTHAWSHTYRWSGDHKLHVCASWLTLPTTRAQEKGKKVLQFLHNPHIRSRTLVRLLIKLLERNGYRETREQLSRHCVLSHEREDHSNHKVLDTRTCVSNMHKEHVEAIERFRIHHKNGEERLSLQW